jgi:maltokinase
LTDTIDALELAGDKRLSVIAAAGGLAAVPMLRDGDGQWRRAQPGDGVAEALLRLLAEVRGSSTRGRFTVRSWTSHTAAGERSVGVDQTNESVIVGGTAVVKWATHLQDGPHPAPPRISVLHDAGFGGMPAPWGLVTWRPPGGAETLVASVDEYLPGAVDGWTWAVDLITAAARDRHSEPLVAATARVGGVTAELHAALSCTATVATGEDAARWGDDAVATLESACALDDSAAVACARARRNEIVGVLDGLGALAGTPIIEGHGDLHVGQILRSGDRFVVTDFDGNPVLPAPQRILPVPAALDVAGMSQSLAHAAIVARKYTELDATALAQADGAGRAAFLDAYERRLAELGHAELYDPGAMHAFRVQQVLREIVYAAQHLPRWMYVPDAALPALLDEGTLT